MQWLEWLCGGSSSGSVSDPCEPSPASRPPILPPGSLPPPPYFPPSLKPRMFLAWFGGSRHWSPFWGAGVHPGGSNDNTPPALK